MKHDMHLTASARAILAAGRHLQRKSGDDVLDILAQKFGAHTDEVERQMKSIRDDVQGVRAHMHEMEQKSARGGGYTPATRSWGEQFVEAEGLKHFASEASRPSRFRLDVMETKNTITAGSTSGGPLDTATRGPEAMMARRPLRVRDLLPVVQISSNIVEWPHQTARPSAAAMVAEGDAKPQSTAAFEMRSVPTRVIAHWVAASRQVLDDAPQLRDIIDGELRYGLALVEEAQILSGDNTGQNLHGLIPQATAFDDPLDGQVTAATDIDTLGSAILQAALANYPPTGIVLHPADWMRLRLIKDGENRHMLGSPVAEAPPRLFGLPVVATQAITAGTFLVGDFNSCATLYDRWQARVEVSTEHSDFFVRNLVAILAEQRIALAVRHPGALITGTFGGDD